MLTIEEVEKAIEEARLKRDFIHELTPATRSSWNGETVRLRWC